jgi:hypothetical protein
MRSPGGSSRRAMRALAAIGSGNVAQGAPLRLRSCPSATHKEAPISRVKSITPVWVPFT